MRHFKATKKQSKTGCFFILTVNKQHSNDFQIMQHYIRINRALFSYPIIFKFIFLLYMGSIDSSLAYDLAVKLQLAAPRAARLRNHRPVAACRRHGFADRVYLKLGLQQLTGHERHDLALSHLGHGETAVLEARRERLCEAVDDELQLALINLRALRPKVLKRHRTAVANYVAWPAPKTRR